VIWERTLKYCFGGDVISASIIVSVFLLGLGIGSFLFRKIKKRALLLLAVAEFLIGLFGMWSYEIILLINNLTAHLNLKLGLGPGGQFAVVFLGAFIFLLFPTIWMGATLPLMFESFIPKAERNTRFIGQVYGINTLGAFAGAFLPTLVFGTLGLPQTIKLTSSLSIGISFCLLALFLKKYETSGKLPELQESVERISWSPQNIFLISFAFLSGFVALVLEILFFRFIGLLHGHSAYSFPIILSAYLLSMSLGSMFWSSLRDRMRVQSSKNLPFLLQAAVASLVPLALFVFEFFLKRKSSFYFNFQQMFVSLIDSMDKGQGWVSLKYLFLFSLPLLILVFPVVFFSGGIFPTLIKNLSENKISIGKSTGILYFSNSVGCTCGSLAAVFLLIPSLGWYASLVLIAALSLLSGAAGYILTAIPNPGEPQPFRKLQMKPVACASLAILVISPVIFFSISDKKIKYKLATGGYTLSPIVSYKEGMTGVAAATEEKRKRGRFLNIYSDGQNMSGLPDLPRHAYLANLPRFQNKLSSVLILGLGGGRNVTDLLSDSRVRKVVAVDWSKEVIELLSTKPVTDFNGNPFQDSRLKIVMADAKKVVKSYAEMSKKFDAVVENLCFPHWSGAGGLNSVQYFQSIKEILKPHSYYYHIDNALKPEERELVATTLSHVFDYVIYHNGKIFICGNEPYSLSESQVVKILNNRMLRRAPGWFVPESTPPDRLYSSFLELLISVNKNQFEKIRPLTDEAPATEYYIKGPFLVEKLLRGFRLKKS